MNQELTLIVMKSVAEFIEVSQDSDVLFLGQCPSTNTKPKANGTYNRLLSWCETVGIDSFSFHNVIPNKINSYDLKDVDVDALYSAVEGKRIIIALGGFVERACKKHGIECYKIDHPSPRNRNLNDAKYEMNMLKRLKGYINEHRTN